MVRSHWAETHPNHLTRGGNPLSIENTSGHPNLSPVGKDRNKAREKRTNKGSIGIRSLTQPQTLTLETHKMGSLEQIEKKNGFLFLFFYF